MSLSTIVLLIIGFFIGCSIADSTQNKRIEKLKKERARLELLREKNERELEQALRANVKTMSRVMNDIDIC